MASIPNPDDVFKHPLIKAIDSLLGPSSMDDIFRELRANDSPLVECRICGEFVNEDEFRCKDTECPLENDA